MKKKKSRFSESPSKKDTKVKNKFSHSRASSDGLKKSAGEDSGALVIRDRSGKIHQIGKPKRTHTEHEARSLKSNLESRPTKSVGRLPIPLPDAPELRPTHTSSKVRPKNPWQKNTPQEKPKGRNHRDRQPSRRSEEAQDHSEHRGIFEKNRKGFGFLSFEDRKREDAFVPPPIAQNLIHGDRIAVRLSNRGEIRSIKLIEHRFQEIVGQIQHRGDSSVVVFERKKAYEEFLVESSLSPKRLEAGTWVRVSIQFDDSELNGNFSDLPPEQQGHRAKILEVYGKELPPSADLPMIAGEYRLIDAHSPAAILEAKSLKLDLDKDLVGRRDLRKLPLITIDGETARDFDDAVYVEKLSSGQFSLWVAIADVSHYVRPGTALDTEAKARATSVYFPERAFHMLPGALSENLCSLLSNEPRLALVAQIKVDVHGKFLKTQVFEAVIESKRRATYTEINNELTENKENKEWEFRPHFDLYEILKAKRRKRGSLDFDLPEAEIVAQPTGEVISIERRHRGDAHRLIEEFMIAANEAVTEWALARHWPFVYRVHEPPSAKAIAKFSELAQAMGAPIRIDPKKTETAQVLNKYIASLEGHPAQTVLNMALLRSMKQAIYTAVHLGHFGLASQAYTHFTSPIRRYPDLLVHRMLRLAIQVERREVETPNTKELKKITEDLEKDCEHCSYRERLAAEAERDANKLKQVRLMLGKLGQEFEGAITGINDHGFFVALDTPFAEGFVASERLNSDFFQFVESRLELVGRRTGKIFRIGERVKVVCARAELLTRQIDFELVEGTRDHLK